MKTFINWRNAFVIISFIVSVVVYINAVQLDRDWRNAYENQRQLFQESNSQVIKANQVIKSKNNALALEYYRGVYDMCMSSMVRSVSPPQAAANCTEFILYAKAKDWHLKASYGWTLPIPDYKIPEFNYNPLPSGNTNPKPLKTV